MNRIEALKTVFHDCFTISIKIWRNDMVDHWTPLLVRLVMILLTWVCGLVVAERVIRGEIEEREQTMRA